MPLRDDERRALLDVARRSISEKLQGRDWEPADVDYADGLCEPGASFVTLRRGGELRGCVGTLEARDPLVRDVAQNASRAAFRDPRFPPLSRREYGELAFHISVLSPPEPLAFPTRKALIDQLRPGVDGLILEAGGLRGTFLPSVWDEVASPVEFVAALERKAGFAGVPDYADVRCARYTTEEWGE